MQVRVCYTTECSDNWRKAIRKYEGQSGLATRQECRDWLLVYGESMNDDLNYDEGEG